MPARALLVLLVMLNVGVATWWLLRPGPAEPVQWTQPADVPRLQLLGEKAALPGTAPAKDKTGVSRLSDEGPAAAAVVAPALDSDDDSRPHPAPGPALPALRCTSFGPFADAASVAVARDVLQPTGTGRIHVRDDVDTPRGWRVWIAPQTDRVSADALMAKIREAGFDDMLVVPSGDEANAIAMGRYSSEPAARRREAVLRAAGFPAQAQPLGEPITRYWLDVAWRPGFDVDSARRAAGAPQVRDVDCETVMGTSAAR